MKTIRLGNNIQTGDFLITPVEQLSIFGKQNRHGVSLSASLEPKGIIINHNGVQWALDTNGKQIAISELTSEVD